MKTKPFYLVIDTTYPPRVVRSRQSWPDLAPSEVVVRLSLNIPDSVLPSVQEIVLDDPDSMAVAVAAEPIAVPE